MASTASKIFKTVKAHVPMIKFRERSMLPKPDPVIVEASPTIASVAVPSSQPHQWIPRKYIACDFRFHSRGIIFDRFLLLDEFPQKKSKRKITTH